MSVPAVSVIVPTLGSSERAPLLLRALDSVCSQTGVRVRPIVVVNGPQCEGELVAALERREDVTIVVLAEASLPEALRIGRSHVDTPWFAELDDDDELLPGALELRVRTLLDHPAAGAVVTNGWRRSGDADTLHLTDVRDVAADPLRALRRVNWLLPGSWLCRTDAVPRTLLDGVPAYLECTYLAVRLASETALRFVQEPTVVYHADTPGSESKSEAYVLGQEAALRRILELDLPRDVHATFASYLAPACHAAARVHARAGRMRAARRCHLRALAQPGGWRFLARSVKVVHPRTAG